MKIQRVLVPVDFSKSSLEAVRHAIDLARPLKAAITVAHVIEPIMPVVPPSLYVEPVDLGPIVDRQERLARAQLTRLVASLKKRGVRARGILETGSPYTRIVAAAKKLRTDVIVMATHGRTGLSHLILGSVTEKVVRLAPCAVLTVRAAAARPRPRRRASPRRRTGD
jgi:nucleotide-binding universal stress UspA family protein